MAEISETFRGTIALPDLDATGRLGAGIADGLRTGDAVALWGELGAGKTTLARHLLRACGVQGRIKSPSYAVLETYALPRLDVHHFDFYRFGDPREWEDAGFRELLSGPGLKLVEWPEQAPSLVQAADLQISLIPDGDGRRAELQALSPHGARLLEALA